jgi:hypothetical protein
LCPECFEVPSPGCIESAKGLACRHGRVWAGAGPETVDSGMYREQYLQPQLGLFETAATRGHIVQEGSPAREKYRNMTLYQKALDYWQNAIKEPQNPRPAPERYRRPTPPGALALTED